MSASSPAKKNTTKAKNRKPVEHPPVAQMVNAALGSLKDRKGSSLASIKKYIAENYTVDSAKVALYIRKYLRKAVADGNLTQVKGTGASGSFKLNKKVEKTPKSPKAKKAKSPKKVAKPKAKKVKSPTKAKKSTPKKAKKSAATKKATPAKHKSKAPKKPAKKSAAKKPAAKK